MVSEASTDYYRQKWSVVVAKQASDRERFVFTAGVVLAVLGVVAACYGYNRYLGFETLEFFFEMSFFGVITVILLSWRWFNLLRERRLRVYRYEVSKDGIRVGERWWEYSEVKVERLARLVKAKLKEIERRQTDLKLSFFAGGRRVELRFDSLNREEKVLKALDKYVGG